MCRAATYRATFQALMRDLSHMETAAAPDLVEWLANLAVRNYSDVTLYQYGRRAAVLLNAHPDKTIDQFTSGDILAEIAKLPEGSRHVARHTYSSWFGWLLEDGRIDRNPMVKVPKIREPRRAAPPSFDEAEVAALEGLPTPDGELFRFLFGSGARKGDALRLQRHHIDLERREVLFVKGKGGKPARVPLTASAVAAIADLDLYERLDGPDYLWYRKRYDVGDPRRRSAMIAKGSFDNWYQRCIEDAGVRYLTPHKTRHTYGRWLKRQVGPDGAPLFDLEDRAMLMRHDDPRTTQKYYPATDVEDLADRFLELDL